jgi:tetratricopeptide (TPR) repeat protein
MIEVLASDLRYDEALDYVPGATCGAPLDALGALSAAQLLLRLGSAEDALDLADRLQRDWPEDLLVHAGAATLWHAAGYYGQERATVRRLKRQFPNHARTMLAEYRATRLRGNIQRDIALLRRAVAAMPGLSIAQGMLAGRLFSAKRYADARAVAQRALELDPRNYLALNALANIAKAENDASTEEELRARLADLSPAVGDAQPVYRAYLQAAHRQFSQAGETLSAKTDSPSSAVRVRALRLQAVYLGSARDRAGLEKACLRLEEDGDQSPEYFCARANLMVQQGSAAEAAIWLRHAAAVCPGSGLLLARLIQFLRVHDRPQELVEVMDDLARNPPKRAIDFGPVIMALDRVGRRDKGRKTLLIGKRLFPESVHWVALQSYRRWTTTPGKAVAYAWSAWRLVRRRLRDRGKAKAAKKPNCAPPE